MLKWKSLMRYIIKIAIDFYNFEEWRGYYTVVDNFCDNFGYYWLFYDCIALLLNLRISIRTEASADLK